MPPALAVAALGTKEESMTYIRPGFLITYVANPIMRRLGGVPALIVRGRRSAVR